MNDLHDEQIDALLHEVAAVDVPEPSPLFWDHFPARVNAAIDAAPARRWWHARWLLVSTATAAVVIVAILGVYVLRPSMQDHHVAVTSTDAADGTANTALDVAQTDASDIERDEAWAVLRSLADELEYDEAREAGVAPRPGAVERAATELSSEERAELVRILEDELKRTGA
jgi:hypothetical protein